MAQIIANKNPIDSQLRRAVGFGFPINGPAVFVPTYQTRDQIKSNLINFLLTNKGERVFNPNFGADLRNLLFEDVSGTTTLDCSLGNYFTLAMPAGGTTELLPSNIQAGQTINIEITQNVTAATLTYDNTIEFPGGTAFTISTGAGEVDVLTLVSFDGVNLKATGLANFT